MSTKDPVRVQLNQKLNCSSCYNISDRDKYVVIDWENIKPADRIQMKKLDAPTIYLKSFPYDYGSILHYGPISFYLSIDRDKPIIHSKRYAPNMGKTVTLILLARANLI